MSPSAIILTQRQLSFFCSIGSRSVVGKDGKVTGLEFDPSFAEKAKETFQKNGVENVEILVGNALEVQVAPCNL